MTLKPHRGRCAHCGHDHDAARKMAEYRALAAPKAEGEAVKLDAPDEELCEKLAALGWQKVACGVCGHDGARGYPRAAPVAQAAGGSSMLREAAQQALNTFSTLCSYADSADLGPTVIEEIGDTCDQLRAALTTPVAQAAVGAADLRGQASAALASLSTITRGNPLAANYIAELAEIIDALATPQALPTPQAERSDTERLDWLESTPHSGLRIEYEGKFGGYLIESWDDQSLGRGATIRAAIDDAMRATAAATSEGAKS